MSWSAELKVLYHLALAPIRGSTHQQRLESFYAGQAEHYDRFRAHLLAGRRELYDRLPTVDGGVWLEMGGGTGSNLEYLGARIGQLRQVRIVDLCSPLLKVAQDRIARHGWNQVTTVEDDVTTVALPEHHADVVAFSYSLTMIPDWFAALEQAWRFLKPGGTIGVVDFYVSRKHVAAGFHRHGAFTRSFWPWWLGHDNVFPSPDHVPYLHRRFEPVHFEERWSRMRYFPLLRVPYFLFVGRKKG